MVAVGGEKSVGGAGGKKFPGGGGAASPLAGGYTSMLDCCLLEGKGCLL